MKTTTRRIVELLNRNGLSDMHGQFYPEANAHKVASLLSRRGLLKKAKRTKGRWLS